MKVIKDLVYLIDMDGTIYRGSTPVPYAEEFIRYLQENERKFLMVTNCPENSTEALLQKVREMGIEIGEENIISSGDATAGYISDNTTYKRIYLIGNEAFKDKLIEKGLQIVSDNPDCVVVGYDREFDYKKMKEATQFILDGAGFICTNCDNTIPEGDKIVPHTGSIVASIETATGVKPIMIEKPERYLLDAAINRFNCSKEQCCMIGDRLDTDIYFGVKQDIISFLVLTGITNKKILKDSEIQPTKIFNDLSEVMLFDKENIY